jgi:ADP-ribose pyrophosphatase
MRQTVGTISSHRIYSGPVISVDEEDVRFPDGTTGTLAIVRHPGASAVVPFLGDPQGDDPALLLIRQYRHAASGFLLEIPAGRLDAGESPEACARRELREETGCTSGTMVPLTTVLTTPGFSDEQIHLFMASDLKAGDAQREPDEFIEPVAIPLSEALARIEKGEIRDAKTIVALLFVAGFRMGR